MAVLELSPVICLNLLIDRFWPKPDISRFFNIVYTAPRDVSSKTNSIFI